MEDTFKFNKEDIVNKLADMYEIKDPIVKSSDILSAEDIIHIVNHTVLKFDRAWPPSYNNILDILEALTIDLLSPYVVSLSDTINTPTNNRWTNSDKKVLDSIIADINTLKTTTDPDLSVEVLKIAEIRALREELKNYAEQARK